jgi:hypothetical protein
VKTLRIMMVAALLTPATANGTPAARDTGEVVSVAREFLLNLERGRLHEAYLQTSQGFQADLSENDFFALASTAPNMRAALQRGGLMENRAGIRALVRLVAVGEAEVVGTIARVRFLELPATGALRPGATPPRTPLTPDALATMEKRMRQLFAPYTSEVSKAEIDQAIQWARQALAEQHVTETIRGTLPRLNYLHLVKQSDGWKVIPFLRVRRRLQPDPKAPGKALGTYQVQLVFHPAYLRRPPNRLHLVIYEVEPERCSRCGDSLAASWQYCPNCGTRRRQPPVDPPADGTTVARRVGATAIAQAQRAGQGDRVRLEGR